jgi:hypothetical protein
VARETQAGGNAGRDLRYKVVEVTVAWAKGLESAHADAVECLIVDTEDLIEVLNEPVDERMSLQGSTTMSETLGEGMTEKVAIVQLGNS